MYLFREREVGKRSDEKERKGVVATCFNVKKRKKRRIQQKRNKLEVVIKKKETRKEGKKEKTKDTFEEMSEYPYNLRSSQNNSHVPLRQWFRNWDR